jgi:spore coat protein U-like protein
VRSSNGNIHATTIFPPKLASATRQESLQEIQANGFGCSVVARSFAGGHRMGNISFGEIGRLMFCNQMTPNRNLSCSFVETSTRKNPELERETRTGAIFALGALDS